MTRPVLHRGPGRANGTEAIRISSDDLDGDIAALQRGFARLIENDGRSATMSDPEGNVFTMIAAPHRKDATS